MWTMKPLLRIITLTILGCYAHLSFAVAPITVTLQSAPSSLPLNGTGTANYIVALRAAVPGPLALSFKGGVPGGTQVIGGSSPCTGGIPALCSSSFTLAPGSSCCLSLTLTANQMRLGDNTLAPLVGTTPATYQGQAALYNMTVTAGGSSSAILAFTPSLSTLALSVNDTSLNAALTGNPRKVSITNTSTSIAHQVIFSVQNPTAANPTITSNTGSSTSCGDILPLGTCILTIIPGSTASAAPSNLNPPPITLTIQGSNTNALSLPINILTYGSVYQAGYVFSITDTQGCPTSPSSTNPCTGSIAGTIIALTDQNVSTPGIIWSSNGVSGGCPSYPTNCDVSFDIIPGIDETSTAIPPNESPTYTAFENMFNGTTYTNPVPNPPLVFSTCNGNTDGTCNSNNILLFYTQYTTNYHTNTSAPYTLTAGPTNLTDYAAGECKAYMGGSYTDWYLPSICEMGYDSFTAGSGCGSSNAPVLQNIQSNLVDPGLITLISSYWSSTESSNDQDGSAWIQFFSLMNPGQNTSGKSVPRGVRCSRTF